MAPFCNEVSTVVCDDFPIRGSRKDITNWLRNKGFTDYLLMNKNCNELVDVIRDKKMAIENAHYLDETITNSLFKLYYAEHHVGELFDAFLGRLDAELVPEINEATKVPVEMAENEAEVYLSRKLEDIGTRQRTRSKSPLKAHHFACAFQLMM